MEKLAAQNTSHRAQTVLVARHMDQQHEEAAKALDLAKRCLDQGIYDKAVRLLEKSLRMRKTAEAEALLTMAQKSLARQDAKAAAAASNGSSSASVTPEPTQPQQQRAFTKEQEDGCKRVLACKTHYDALGVGKDSSQDEIKKAYRKLALRFHPDKCGAPKAEEAFKKLSKAFEVLSDENERAHYDRYGDADPRAGGGGGHHHHHHHHQHPFQQQDMDMDDILRFFMQGGMMGGGGGRGGPFGGGGARFRPQQQQHRGGGGGGAAELQPISLQQIFFFLVSLYFMFSSFGGGGGGAPQPHSNNLYSLFPTQQYSVPRRTAMNGVVSEIPYYVDPKFANSIGKSPRDLYYVETAVEASQHHALKERCAQDERKYRRSDTDACAKKRDFELKRSKRS